MPVGNIRIYRNFYLIHSEKEMIFYYKLGLEFELDLYFLPTTKARIEAFKQIREILEIKW